MTGDLPKSLFEDLEAKYLGNKPSGGDRQRAAAAWAVEGPIIRDLLPTIMDELGSRYRVERALGVGGVGIVLEVFDNNLEIPRALKFARPTPSREPLFAEIMTGEISYLRRAIHPNIVEIYQHGKVAISTGESHYYIMQFIPGARDANEYFERDPANIKNLLPILSQILIGLEHLHKLDVLHGDIKLENILVSDDGRAVISDLGSARHLHEGVGETVLVFTRAYAHPELQAIAAAADSDPNRARTRKLPRDTLRFAFDLYALGANILRLLREYEQPGRPRIDAYIRKYLKLMGCRLLDGRNTIDQLALGLPASVFTEIKYTAISQAANDLRKLTGQYSLSTAIRELDYHAVQTVQTSSLSPTPFTARLARIISHPLMRRLAGVPQLGIISLVYPTATHSRLEHVLGTFTNVVRYCDALYHDPLNPLFKQIVKEADIIALLLAALFHDLGQFPLAHDLEDAAPELFDHEKISTGLLDGTVDAHAVAKLRKLIIDDWEVQPERVAEIIKTDPTDDKAPIVDRILSTILSGPIDADKLDYLVRDSGNLNVPFGLVIDFQRLLQCLTVVYKAQANKIYVALGIHEKGKIPAETVAFARYAMFGTVYWHHTSRIVKAMLHRAVWEGLPKSSQRRQWNEYRKELIDFVLRRDSFVIMQKDLFQNKLEFEHLSQVLPPDREMIEWLAAHTSKRGQQLLEMLVGRQLFSRVLVISRSKSQKVWEALTAFRKANNFEELLSLQMDVQKRSIDYLRNPPLGANAKQSESIGKASIDKLVAADEAGTILILIDIPTQRTGSPIPLSYLPESSRRDTVNDWVEPASLEDSEIWIALHRQFVESVGKIRVFCHPEFRNTFEIGIPREQFEDILEASARNLSRVN
jgi:HD superfamily phosphohydrolase/serine/threonine protein kinase